MTYSCRLVAVVREVVGEYVLLKMEYSWYDLA